MRSRWIRLNVDWHLSDWLVVLSAESRLAWVQLLCHVKTNGFGGRCKALHPSVAEQVWFVNEPSIRQMLQAAENAGALVVEDGEWRVSKWREYQGDETNAERQKRYRQREPQVQSGQVVTPSNAVVTEVTPTETETETETETMEKKIQKEKLPQWFDRCTDEVSQLAQFFAGIKIAGGRSAFDEVSEEGCEALIKRRHEVCPNDTEWEYLLADFTAHHKGRRKPPYTSPTRAFHKWMNNAEPTWRKLKRSRSYKAKGEVSPEVMAAADALFEEAAQ